MFGLGKKPEPAAKLDIPVVTIPTEFYAGANPKITFKQVEKIIDPLAMKPQPEVKTAMPTADKKAFDKATAKGSGQAHHPVNVLGNRKKILIIGGVLFVVFVVGATAFYWFEAQKQNSKVPPPPQVSGNNQPNQAAVPPETNTAVVPTSTLEQVTPLATGRMEFPSLFLTSAGDLDNDGLTDAEEALFKSDPGIPDSDSDSHLDGSEVYHLYNPAGKEPIRIIESGTVVQFRNPVYNYALYHPLDWAVGNVENDYKDMLFSTITGDAVEVRTFEKPQTQSFFDWLSEQAPTERFSDISEFTTRFGEKGFRRYDDLVFYFVTPTRVYVLAYHTTDSIVANYPNIIEMMARSFRTDANNEIILTAPTGPLEMPESVTSTEDASLEGSATAPPDITETTNVTSTTL